MKSSWKTTVFGLLGACGGAVALLDGLPHWLALAAKVAAALGVAGIGFAARDNDKSSEDVGAKPAPGPGSVAAVLLAGCLLAFMISGCQSTPQRIVFNTLDAPAVTVDHAMTAWGDYVRQFHPPVGQEQAVERAFAKYQAAMVLAIDAAQSWITLTTANSTNAPPALLKSQQAQQAASQALGDLVQLISQFGAKL